MKKRIYVCHTYYHVYIACLKEFNLPADTRGEATLVLSTMSNNFGNLKERAEKSGLFEEVIMFEEKEDTFFKELDKYKVDRKNIVFNMLQRIFYTKKFGRLEAQYVPVDFKQYKDIYVFCDSDPIGYYLSYKKIHYHALEDGLNCIQWYDTARYDNKGHFEIKAWMSKHNLIFIQNGYGKYCIDMEINDKSVVPYPCEKYIEVSRDSLADKLNDADKEVLLKIFIEDINSILDKLNNCAEKKVLVLTEPLCDLDTRKRIFKDIIKEYGVINGENAAILIKPHPRDVLDYNVDFSEHIIINGMFPMEVLNFIPNLKFARVISVLTVTKAIRFADEVLFLGNDFMDRYEEPSVHRQNEQI